MLKYKNVLKIPSSFRTASLSCFILKKSYKLNISLNFYFFHLFNGANVQGFTRLYHYLWKLIIFILNLKIVIYLLAWGNTCFTFLIQVLKNSHKVNEFLTLSVIEKWRSKPFWKLEQEWFVYTRLYWNTFK